MKRQTEQHRQVEADRQRIDHQTGEGQGQTDTQTWKGRQSNRDRWRPTGKGRATDRVGETDHINWPIRWPTTTLASDRNRQAGRQTDRQAGRQAGRQTLAKKHERSLHYRRQQACRQTHSLTALKSVRETDK